MFGLLPQLMRYAVRVAVGNLLFSTVGPQVFNNHLLKRSYMRLVARLLVLFAVVTLTAGPLLAAPVSLNAGPTVSAPHSSTASPLGTLAKLVGSGVIGFGAIRIADTAKLAAKFKSRAGAAVNDYKDGVAAGAGEWEGATKAAKDSYAQGVQEAISDNRFERGVNGSSEKYRKNATELGATRYVPGINNAEGAWASGVAPFLDKLKGLQLPPRGPRRSPQNQQRSNIVQAELGKMATGK
jgi:hypothetical protein